MKVENNLHSLDLLNKMELMQVRASKDIALSADNAANQVSFGQTMKTMIQDVNQQQLAAGKLMTAVDAGRSDDLVGAMVMSQKAGLSFSVLMQVRNKLMSGLDDIMRMPL
ncbi:flagellar hook-basal body complex protein FliE [Thalassomonas viridans]|uniref:Flagellar hook-basal body complex protein FliE n=1 Tax=Thalassomonas viridans TaxID=137584 RepID=A0AAE9Z4L0_9GAMM|nr:flagellar hook-basal body complex protein FliE [Thalassomonas viridans]WDE05153.1 flagellar hook-basal body complex protein FliE [Thalassomonas viridans]